MRPNIWAFLKNCPDNAGFLRFCSDFCNFSACSECYWAVCQTAKQRFKRYALNLESKQTQKPRFLPGFLLESRPDFHKKEPEWTISNTAITSTPVSNSPFNAIPEKLADLAPSKDTSQRGLRETSNRIWCLLQCYWAMLFAQTQAGLWTHFVAM